MTNVQTEIMALEEQLRVAEMGPDPEFFEDALADNAVMISHETQPYSKAKVVQAHRPEHGSQFTRVEMKDLQVIDHGDVAVVTCKGTYEGPHFNGTLKFMRVWAKKDHRWQIIAGSVIP